MPACLAYYADTTGYLPFKMAVPLVCAALLMVCFLGRLRLRLDVWFVIGAFVFSAIGDYFLSSRRGHEHYFVLGIAAFFVAHLGYLGFSLCNGRLDRITMAVLLAGYLPYFVFALRPAIGDPVLFAAVLLYLLISCVGLAAAAGLRLPPLGKWLYVFGIFMVVLSDTIISFSEFLKFRDWELLDPAHLLPGPPGRNGFGDVDRSRSSSPGPGTGRGRCDRAAAPGRRLKTRAFALFGVRWPGIAFLSQRRCSCENDQRL